LTDNVKCANILSPIWTSFFTKGDYPMNAQTETSVVDVFAQVPEFLAAFNHILEKGFFEEVQFQVGMPMGEGKVYNCTLVCSGCIPNSEQYRSKGCGVIIDPNAVVATCRNLAAENQVDKTCTEVKSQDWPLWDEEGNKVIGSKGQRTELSLTIWFRP
jgi:hypothetical protein